MLLAVPTIKHYDKYLGLPSFFGRQTNTCFNQTMEWIWAKMQGWKERLLSQASKEVMIKEVIQSITTFSMSVFHLLVGLINDIEAMICKFGGEIKTIPGRCNGLNGVLSGHPNPLVVWDFKISRNLMMPC